MKRRSRDQWLDQQIKALEAAGCIRIFADKKSGNNAEREELRKALDYLRPGDILVVSSLDRLGRSLQDLISIVAGLRKQGVGLRSLKESIDTTTPGGRLVFHVFAALAEFVRELIVEGAHEGLDSARARGQRLGRPPAMTPEQVAHAPRTARPARCKRRLDRPAAPRQPLHHLQVRPRNSSPAAIRPPGCPPPGTPR